MVHALVRSRRSWITFVILFLLAAVAGCSAPTSQPAATTAPAESTATASAIQPAAATAAPVSPAPPADSLLVLPEAFRYEVTLRSVGSSTGAPTIITGQYRGGAWTQSAHTGDGPAEEAAAIGGITYTRPAEETTWTRWPGVSFDAGYGLASPFTVLRLYPLADEKTRGELAPVPGAPVATLRVQAVIAAATVKRLLAAGIAAVVRDGPGRTALEAQVAPLTVGQTITCWRGEDNRIYRATATLLAADPAGQPQPWLEATWRFWAYDDPAIAIAAPTDFQDAVSSFATRLAPAAPASPGDVNLVVRVFESPGVPAEELAVTIFPINSRQLLDWRKEAEARFKLPPGRYDVLVQMDYAEEWLRGVEVTARQIVTREVVFDFGALKLTVTQEGKLIPADIVTYPAGDRQNWVDWRSDNPATIRLRAGIYDVELAYANYRKKQTVTGVVVKAGEMTEKVVEVEP